MRRRPVNVVNAIRRRVPLLDAATLAAIFAMALFFARPLLEEWGLSLYFRVSGVHSYWSLADNFPLRPLQAAPSGLQSALFGEGTIAFAVTFGLLLVAKYAALRWAVGPFLPARAAWLVACMGTVLIPWNAGWRGRYSAAELSSVFLFVALGAILRGRDRLSPPWIALAAVSIGLMLATYQALAVCAAVLPVVALIGLAPARTPGGDTLRTWIRRVVVAWTPVALGALLYAVYGVIAVKSVGSAGYEGVVAEGDSLNAAGVWHAIPDVYRTEFSRAPWTLPLLVGLLSVLVVGPISALPGRPARALWSGGFVIGILLLPLAGLPYVGNPAWLSDPDRIGFPASVGFVLLVTTALLRFRDFATSPAGQAISRQAELVIPLVVAVLLLWTLPLGNENRRNYQTEDAVLTGTARAFAASHGKTTVVLQDYTGTLGDVYTLYQTTYLTALQLRRVPVLDAVLCTPLGVDRITPDANALQVGTTSRCEAVPRVKQTLVLNVGPAPGGGLSFVPVG